MANKVASSFLILKLSLSFKYSIEKHPSGKNNSFLWPLFNSPKPFPCFIIIIVPLFMIIFDLWSASTLSLLVFFIGTEIYKCKKYNLCIFVSDHWSESIIKLSSILSVVSVMDGKKIELESSFSKYNIHSRDWPVLKETNLNYSFQEYPLLLSLPSQDQNQCSFKIKRQDWTKLKALYCSKMCITY